MTIRSPIALGVALCVSGCAINPKTGQPEVSASVKTQFNSIFNSEDPCSNNDRNIGIAVGAVAGGVVGYLAHGAKGAAAGVVIGAGGGFLVGHALDARRCELYRIAQANGLKLASAPITQGKAGGANSADKPATVGLDVQLENKSDEFVAGTAELTPQARKYLAQIANQYSPKTLMAALPPDATPDQRAQASARKVLIVGHTDENDSSLGADAAVLSQQRAKAVAKVFVDQGVPVQNIFYQGAGDTLPIAPNATDQGREENQRVQIVDVPTEADLQQFLSTRTADPANYRFAKTDAASLQETSSVQRKNTVNLTSSDHAATSKPAIKPRSKPTTVAKTDNAGIIRTEAGANPPVASNDAPAAASQSRATVAASNAGSGYNFGGTPTAGSGIPVRLGSTAAKSSFSLISNANAGAPMTLNSCLGDRPHVASSVRNLATDQVLNVRDYLPGFYGAPWAAGLGGNLVALLDVRVPSDAGSPVPQPRLKIYKDYAGNVNQKPSYSARVPVNVYRGSDATLYRVFVGGPMQCMDLVVPVSKPRATGNVYYTNRSVDYTASGDFALR
ncbi:OmpA family protein [Paraburkholderia hospita]|uniref:Cell envelope biogenesis protein OmpA n=1 Tax=Paraburkholderia hospita TaxID=169430 RepID=A0AAN1JI04_9BURK|nr:OmpA family protein [Paraburkholderia hospita]AUT74292.1 cell envelope biogenesis protein OmpA [Paraburkholderia hospita]EIN01270.1 OmpA protein [Paraburkholderia hospita]OUL84562.1 cell envelope biogenesis protein OmpA [Paraburkholderia hospita]OUL87018.1 cell envelope biogenesis protein OmpA [Paraburkholderia hospita]SEH58109.1 OmpA family protein [Paraburkholderia hospita]